MKKFKIVSVALLMMSMISLSSCTESGISTQKLNGNEQNLPDELKGLKVYWVSTGNGGGVNVAILNGQVNSTTYNVGKVITSTIILNKQNGKLIEVSNILIENDSLIVCRK
jgi:hypothetical protein